jgi:hypothetical protein
MGDVRRSPKRYHQPLLGVSENWQKLSRKKKKREMASYYQDDPDPFTDEEKTLYSDADISLFSSDYASAYYGGGKKKKELLMFVFN